MRSLNPNTQINETCNSRKYNIEKYIPVKHTLLSQAIIFNSKDTLQERPLYLLTRFLCLDISSFSCNTKASNKLICDECYISVFNDEEINTN